MKKFLLPTIKKDSSSPLGRGCPEGTGEGKDNKVSSLIRPPATFSQREKGMLFVFLFSLFFLFSINHAKAATEFISIVDTGGAADADYSSLSTWETGLGTNLTAPSTLVFSGVVTGTAPIDNSSVTLYRSGASTGVGATVVHTAKTGTQILLENVTNPSYGFTTGDEWRIDASNLFTIDATTPDQPQITAKCRATTGAADTTAVTINGWDTDATHYIKIWTDPSENYRHQGKWDESKYRMTSYFDVYEDYLKIDGLQIKRSVSSGTTRGIYVRSLTSGANRTDVNNNIIACESSGTANISGYTSTDVNNTSYVWNNIIYGCNNHGLSVTSTSYVYNNTIYGNYVGIRAYGGTIIVKNNISYNNTDNYNNNFGGGSFDASSTNNLSGPSSDAQIASTSAPQNGVTVTFADSANNDFHLDSSDTGAKNNGTILYDSGDDANLNFTTDIDNEARKDSAGTWDIGADENVAKIYRSVGAGATSPLAWGGTADSSYGNMTISGLIATFWRPLPDNVGVGDAIQYDADNTGGIDKIVFITKRIDSTHYSVRKADGTAPDATTSLPNSGWGIYRSYISLSNAEAGTENTSINDTVENFDTGNVNLTTNNLQWNIACYANGTTADSTAVTISGWTTTADNYMRVYTPTRTDEVGTTQRHAGKWDTSKYYVSVTDSNAFNIQADYAWLDGVQITETSPTSSHILLWTSNITAGSNNVRISNNIFKGHNSGTYGEYGLDINDPDIIVRVWNNIIYDIPDLGGSNRGISFSGAVGYIYSNTVIGPNQGIRVTAGDVTAKNNLIQTTSSAYLLTGGTWNSASSYNLADDATAPGSNPQNTKTVSFIDATNKDFHLAPGDSVARNIGADLANDPYLPIQTDIDSSGSIDGKSCDMVYQDSCLTRPRATSWDIGADELITKIYRSVGVGTTAAILSGTSPAISLTISGNTGTFSTFPTSADFGVGDVIRYDSDNNGSLDSTAFLTAIDSTAKTVTLQNSTGGTAPQMAVGDYDWKLYRAYTSLSAWESGTENTGVGVTYDSGDRDIATNSEQWNVACYANSGTEPDSTGVTISGWTTKPTNYIRIYTPTAANEVTNSQRHQGKWDDTKYRLEVTDNNGISNSGDYVKIDGLQIKKITNGSTILIGALSAGSNKIEISNNILTSDGSDENGHAISDYNNPSNNEYIWNNIIFNFVPSNTDYYAIFLVGNAYVYNNTISSCNKGIRSITARGITAKNNILKDIINTADANTYAGTFNPASDYNATDSTDDIGAGTHNKTSQTFSFIDSTNKDFHLATFDTSAKDAGADLSKDLYLPITSDIDGHPRSNLRNSEGSTLGGVAFDIGADEGATAIYRSLAPGATSSIASGTSPANSMIIAGTSVTFGTAPGDTIGVGDAIQYDSDNNGSIDSVAFITYRTDSTHYTIQDRTGGTPISTSATDYDWSIYRAYTSLRNASGSTSGGTENTGLSDNIEHFDIDWAASHGKNIYTANQQWNIAAYANSTTADSTATSISSAWTTYPTNYLKVYTPTATTEVGTSQRHQGKWDTSKYYIDGSFSWTAAIVISTQYFRADGLQARNTTSNGTAYTINITPSAASTDYYFSNNIIRGGATRWTQFGFAWSSIPSNFGRKASIWNNVIYEGSFGISFGSNSWTGPIKIYNNTIYDCTNTGIAASRNNFILKNNIVQNCTDGYSGTTSSSSDYNISDIAGDTTGISPSYQNGLATTVAFADPANYDFHLGVGDTAARNSGADLSADSNLPVTTDIDGHSRPTGTSVVDIGADEGATAVYYSVGQSTSTDFKVASNVTVNGYTATFTTAQTGNIGVGDIVTYDGGSCYITGKTSTSIWSCQNATGGTAPQVSGVSVTSIKRAFASLNSSISGSTAPTFLNTSDLKTNNYILNIPCYMDSGTTPDTTAVTIQGYTTAVPNYIKVYTPNNTTTEANQSQRHQGKWDDGKYNLSVSNTDVLSNRVDYFRIDGLQISTPTVNSNGQHVIHFDDSLLNVSNQIEISNCILKGANSNSYYQSGIRGSNGGKEKVYAWNNIFYNFGPGDSNQYARVIYSRGSTYLYNSTIIGGYYGLYRSSGSFKAKNVYAGGSTNGDFTSVTLTTSASSDTTGTAGLQSIGVGLTTFTNVTSGQEDYHLASNSALKNVGTDLSSGTYPDYAFTTDIDDNTRNTDSRGWDIGADESATPIYYSVGQSSSDLKTGSPTLSIDSSGNGTLSVSQTGNMGVGDYIEYGTSPYNKAYITGKTSSTVWTVQSATGTMLGVATTEPVNSIKHSYTSLSGAIAGASGSTMMNTTDLYTNNLQLNVPCYMDSGTADTTAVTISGYTTYSTNYIKVYTPTSTTTEANNSQRHQGKWDDGKYRLEVTSSSISLSSNFVNLDGLQVKLSSTFGADQRILANPSSDAVIQLSNNIIKGNFSNTANNKTGINAGYSSSYVNRTIKASNNIIYNFINGSNSSMLGISISYNWKAYLYNNTVYNSYYGFYRSGGTVIAKNNLSYNNTYDYSGSFDASSTNNLSKDATSPNTALRNKTVNFVDSANYDFHLAESDTAARNSGADLSTDAINRVPTDIDGNSRPTLGAYDIGADEGSTYIYYSVGQNTSDHKTLGVGGSTPTITLSGYSATLDVAQTAPNIGVGDKITYTGGSCYISAKTSDDKMHWNCQNATGGTAVQVSGVSVTSIAHAFSSLSGAIAGASGGSYLNTGNLYTGNYILNVPCYYDTGADTTVIDIDNWTTAANNYIKVYTPNNTTSEVNQTQRHSGKWDDEKYRLDVTLTSGGSVIDINPKNARLEGLQIKVSNGSAISTYGISVSAYGADSRTSDIRIYNNIIKAGTVQSGSYSLRAINGGGVSAASSRQYIWNNIIYDFSNGTTGYGIYNSADTGYTKTQYIYNNTIYNCYYGIRSASNSNIVAKNNIVQGATDGYYGSFASGSDYNISNVAADTTGGAHDKAGTTVTFIGANDNNYHLGIGDTAAKNQGIKLASYSDDSNLNFTTDIDGNARAGDWSIGADDGPFAEAQSDVNNPTDNPNIDINNGLVGYWSFNGDDMKGIGIGGTAIDRSGNNNNGILAGTAPGPTAAVGKRGQALKFDGMDDYVDIGDAFYSDAFTACAWVKEDSLKTIANIFVKRNSSGTTAGINEWWLYVGNGTVGFQSNVNNSTVALNIASDITISSNSWYHICVVQKGNGNEGYIYINGEEHGSAVQTGTMGNQTSVLQIGVMSNNNNTRFWNGQIDEARIYNRALSSDEIGHLYRMGQVTIDKDLGNAVIKK